MPTYDYACDACKHEFEIFESITVEPQKKCPKCKKNKLRRLFGAGAGLVFKGSGFYQTDYRSDSYKKAAEADKPKTDSGTPSTDSSGGQTSAKSDAVASTASAEPKPSTTKESRAKKPNS
jgi:putative FmdB family regulatory protein